MNRACEEREGIAIKVEVQKGRFWARTGMKEKELNGENWGSRGFNGGKEVDKNEGMRISIGVMYKIRRGFESLYKQVK